MQTIGANHMGDIAMVDDVCIECGRPLDGDDEDLCEGCLRDLDDTMKQRFKPHLTEDRDGKRLAKSRRPKHKPTPERDKLIPVPKPMEPGGTPDRGALGGRRQPPGGRRQPPGGRRPPTYERSHERR